MLVSHNLNDVFEVADRIAVLYLGRLVVAGTGVGVRPSERRRVHDDRNRRRTAGAPATATLTRGDSDVADSDRPTQQRREPRPDDGAVGSATRPSDRDASWRSRPPPEVLATSLGEYFAAWGARSATARAARCRCIVGLIVDRHLLPDRASPVPDRREPRQPVRQAAIFIMFGAAEMFALLLSEIDLSIGYVGRRRRLRHRRADRAAGQPPVVARRSSAACSPAAASASCRAR